MSRESLRRQLAGVAVATVLLLMLPWLAKRFTGEVVWTAGDFLAAGVLLAAASTGGMLAQRGLARRGHRVLAGLAIAAVAAARSGSREPLACCTLLGTPMPSPRPPARRARPIRR